MARPYLSFDITTVFHSKLNEMTGQNNEYVLRFTANIPNPDGGATALVKTAGANFGFIKTPFPTFTNASDALETIGVLYSPSLPLNCTDIFISTGITLFDLFQQANEYTDFLPNAFNTPTAGFYQHGVYCTVTEQIGAGAVTTIFRGFVNRDDLTKNDNGGLNPAVNVDFTFTLIDRHRLFLENTSMDSIATAVLANANLKTFLMPDTDVPDETIIGGYLIKRNNFKEGVTQTQSDSTTKGTYERFLAWQEIINIVNSAAGCENAVGKITASHFGAKYEESYPYSDQGYSDVYDPTIGTNPLTADSDGVIKFLYAPVSKLLGLDDSGIGGINWNGIDVGESWTQIQNGLELLAAICNPYLACRFAETATNVVQLQIGARNDYAATIDLDAMIAAGTTAVTPPTVRRPFASQAKNLSVSERDGQQYTYPDTVTSKTKEEVHATVINRHYKQDEFKNDAGIAEAAVRNFYYYHNSQIVDAIQGINHDTGWLEIVKIIATPNNNGIAYAIGISTDPSNGSQRAVIYRTPDSGVNWYLLSYNNSGLLRDGIALDDNTVVVVGDGGIVFKTTDSGATWTAKTSGITNNLFQVQIATGTTLYAIATSINSSGSVVNHIIKSVNSGEAWAIITNPAVISPATFTAMNARYSASATKIFLLIAIHDDGTGRTENWITNDTNGETFNIVPSTSVVTRSSIHCYFVTSDNVMYAAGGGAGGLLWHTTDNWGSHTEITNVPDQTASNYFTIFYDSTAAYLFVGGNSITGGQHGILYRTSDGGATWSDKTPTGATQKQVNSIAQIDLTPNDTIVLGVNSFDSSLYMPRTIDSGDTWTQTYRRVDITNALTACPMRIAWNVPGTSNVQFWTDSNVLTTVALTAFLSTVQAPSNYALTLMIDVRNVFRDLFLQISTGFSNRILNSANFLLSPLLKYKYLGAYFRSQTFTYDPNTDLTKADLIQILS